MVLRQLLRSVPNRTKCCSYILYCRLTGIMASRSIKVHNLTTAAATLTSTSTASSCQTNGITIIPIRRKSGISSTTTKTTTIKAKKTFTNKEVSHAPTFEERVFYPAGRQSTTQFEINNNEQINAEYEEAIKMLNTLQPNAETIAKIAQANSPREGTVMDTVKYLERSGILLSDLEKLSFIHVSGTKGKGTTCALTESILRAHGIRTGFFSSPHILATTERIRINGEPIGKQKFTKMFWRVFKRLKETGDNPMDMPAYFKFMTILSFHIFMAEKVDVVVLEVGIGGEFDCTNIIRNVKTIGITSLGLEHTPILGNTLEAIAWQKAGIIKPNSNVYTHVTQPICLDVIRQRAAERNAIVHIAPPFVSYFQHSNTDDWQRFNDVIHLNGSLAIQLANDWLQKRTNGHQCAYVPNSIQLSDLVLQGLLSWHWPGRCQIVDYMNMRLHLDGAHTIESMRVCSDWFAKVTRDSANPKVLIFNRYGDSDSRPLLDILLHDNRNFDWVGFTPNLTKTNKLNSRDQQMLKSTNELQMKRTELNAQCWRELCAEANLSHNSHVFQGVCEAFDALRERFDISAQQVDVLVTGSIHLIGCTVAALNSDEFSVDKAISNNNNNVTSPNVTAAAATAAATAAMATDAATVRMC